MRTKKIKWGKIILTVLLFLFGVACIFPFVFMLSSSFKPLYPTTLIISKKPGNTGISRDIRTEFTTDLLLSD